MSAAAAAGGAAAAAAAGAAAADPVGMVLTPDTLVCRCSDPNWVDKTHVFVATLYSMNSSGAPQTSRKLQSVKAILVRFAQWVLKSGEAGNNHCIKKGRITVGDIVLLGLNFLQSLNIKSSSRATYTSELLGPILAVDNDDLKKSWDTEEIILSQLVPELRVKVSHIYRERDETGMQRSELKQALPEEMMDPKKIIQHGVSGKHALRLAAIIHLILMPVDLELENGEIVKVPLALRGKSACSAGFTPECDLHLDLKERVLTINRQKVDKIRERKTGVVSSRVRTRFLITDDVLHALEMLVAAYEEEEEDGETLTLLWDQSEAAFNCAIATTMNAAATSLGFPSQGRKWLRRVRYTANSQALEKYGHAPSIIKQLTEIHDHNVEQIATTYKLNAKMAKVAVVRAFEKVADTDKEYLLNKGIQNEHLVKKLRTDFRNAKTECDQLKPDEAIPLLIQNYEEMLIKHKPEPGVRGSVYPIYNAARILVYAFNMFEGHFYYNHTCLCGSPRKGHEMRTSCLIERGVEEIESYWNACKMYAAASAAEAQDPSVLCSPPPEDGSPLCPSTPASSPVSSPDKMFDLTHVEELAYRLGRCQEELGVASVSAKYLRKAVDSFLDSAKRATEKGNMGSVFDVEVETEDEEPPAQRVKVGEVVREGDRDLDVSPCLDGINKLVHRSLTSTKKA